jgi:hypothetical protein
MTPTNDQEGDEERLCSTIDRCQIILYCLFFRLFKGSKKTIESIGIRFEKPGSAENDKQFIRDECC